MDPEAESLFAALEVRRQATRGALVGVAVSTALFVVFVVFPGATDSAPLYYVALWFVLVLSLSALIAAVLVAVAAARLARHL